MDFYQAIATCELKNMHIQDRLRITNTTIIHLSKDLILYKNTVKKKLRSCVLSTQAQCHSEDYKNNQQRHQIFKAIITTQATKRILIVDDEADINFTFKVVLQNDGFKVDSFTDPLLALEDFNAGIYDLVLLDIVMPVINGFELYEKIKKIDNKVKICFLTASANYCYCEALGKEGFPDLNTKNAFIYKPIENTEMIKRVNQITIAASPKV